MSEWLDLMLDEIARKAEERKAAVDEAHRRQARDAPDSVQREAVETGDDA